MEREVWYSGNNIFLNWDSELELRENIEIIICDEINPCDERMIINPGYPTSQSPIKNKHSIFNESN